MTGNGLAGRVLDPMQKKVKQIRTRQLTHSFLLTKFVSVTQIKVVLLYYYIRDT